MTDAKILNIFYSKIVPEAANGKVDCYFMLNVIFTLVVDNTTVSKCKELTDESIIVPTLKISDKALFDSLLVEYVRKALDFYDSTSFRFLDDLNNENIENLEEVKEEYLIKYIIVATLFANASINDFTYPINFLKSRIAMFDRRIIEEEDVIDLGYINSIGAKIYVLEEKSPIKAETPYRIRSYLEFDDGYQLHLPEIYAGNIGSKYQLYGIQKTSHSNELEERPYLKQIRKGFIAKINGAPEHYFLAIMLFISLCPNKEIEVKPFLVERWNAKRMSLNNKAKMNQYLTLHNEETTNQNYLTSNSNDYFLKLENEQEKLQSSITDNLIRYFTKLKDVTSGIDFWTIPFEINENLIIKISENILSRSVAFNELFKLVNDYKNNNYLRK